MSSCTFWRNKIQWVTIVVVLCCTPLLYICPIVAAWHNYITTGSTSKLQVQLLSRLALKANRTPEHLPSRRFLASHVILPLICSFEDRMCLGSPCFICCQIWDEFRLAGAIQVSNQYPVCTFFSICTISPNLNGSGGSFLPQDFLECTGQVINGNAFWDVSMTFWDHICCQIFGREPLRLVSTIGWDKNGSMKIILPKPQDAAYIAYIQGSEKNCPGFELSCSRHMRTGLPTGDIIEYLESHQKMMTRICKI